jgi:hypothetical protein
MQKNIILIILFSTLGLSISSCKKHKRKNLQVPKEQPAIVSEKSPTQVLPQTETTSKADPTDAVEKELEQLKIDEIDFTYFTSSSKMSYRDVKQSQNAQVNFRIKKDSLIWFSVSAFGLEAVRGIIRADSVYVIDKLHREFYAYNFNALSQEFNVDLNFSVLQSLVLGNLPVKKRGKNKYIKRENDYYLLHQEDGKVFIDNYIGDQNRKLRKLQLSTGSNANNKLTMTFGDFQAINEKMFPFESLIKVDYQNKEDQKFYETLIELKHKKVEFPVVSPGFPFVIPKNYTKK